MSTRRNNLALFLGLAFSVCASAQSSLHPFGYILQEIEINNPTLIALRAGNDADKAEYMTGLAPEDPLVELGYLWGTPSEIGNRLDINVSQSFDFPTVYVWRKRLAEGQCTGADVRYNANRRKVLLDAEIKCIEIVYQRMKQEHLGMILQNGKNIVGAVQRKYDQGGAGILDLNGARLDCLKAEQEYHRATIELNNLLSELKSMNGGKDIDPGTDTYVIPFLPGDMEEWYNELCNDSPDLRVFESEMNLAQLETRLVKAGSLPKLNISYVSERIAGTTLQGIEGGVSIPLWSNKGRVKAAEARSEAIAKQAQEGGLKFYEEVRRKYAEAQELSSISQAYMDELGKIDMVGNLSKAYDSGEISISEYSRQKVYWCEITCTAIENEKELAIKVAELFSLGGY